MQYLLTIILAIVSYTAFAIDATHASDSILHILNATKSPAIKIKLYRDLADIHFETPEARTYLLKMYTEAAKINNREKMLEALGDILIEEINYLNEDSISKYLKKVKEIGTQEELKSIEPFCQMDIFEAQCYQNQQEELIQEKLRHLDTTDSTTTNIYNEISSIYTTGISFYMTKQFDNAVTYIERAAKLAESLPNKEKFRYWRRITAKQCYAYARAGKAKEAAPIMENLINWVEQYYKKNIQKERPFYPIDLYLLQYYAFMITNLKYITIEQENDYWNRIQQIGRKLTHTLDKYNYCLCANNYYMNNRTQPDLNKAISANDSLIKYATSLAPSNLPRLYDVSSQLYEEKKEYKNALKYLKMCHQLQDSLDSETMREQLNELQVKYDIKSLNSEKVELKIKNKQILIFSMSILLIVVIIICSYLYFSLKKEKRMKEELKILHSKAQESEKMKQAFINSICHEIRTPLNAIVGFSDLVLNDDIDEEMRREFPAEIQKNTTLLTGLVNSMLEVANLDISEEKLPCEPTDIRDICINQMEYLNRKIDIEYNLDITEENRSIPTNAHYLSLVIEHLLSNANKFTEKGTITLGYKIDETKKCVFITVTDTGCGIPEDKHEEVFNRFSKLDTFIPGNGLGLYLCHLIVKRLYGEIRIDSEYTKGTRMIVSLPIE